MTTVVVGRGALGTTLHRALVASGRMCRLVAGRETPLRALEGARVVVLAVPDARIAEVAARLAEALPKGAILLHAAGARTAEELATARAHGASVAAMHPLVSFADRKRPPSLAGSTFVISGDAKAVRAARGLARAVGARALVAPLQGPAYHAAAALAANGTVGLVHAAVALLEALGADRRAAERALAGLLRTVVSNVEHVGVPNALTGPIARGDAETVAAHRRAIASVAPEVLAAYDGAAPAILACAEARGLPDDRARAIEAALSVTPPRRAAGSRARSRSRRPRPRA
ncbi:MAG: DUF2520 domain-containing protein [Polyangiales bacterium]